MPAKKEFPTFLEAIFLIALLLFVLMVGTRFVLRLDRDGGGALRIDALAAQAAVWAVSFGAMLAWGVRRTGRPLGELFPSGPVAVSVIPPLCMVICGFGVLASELDNIHRFFFPPPPEIESLGALFSGESTAGILWYALVVAVFEELFFRGLLLQGFRRLYPEQRAMLYSAFVFSFFQMTDAVTAFFIGLFLSWLCIRTASVWVCIGARLFYLVHGRLAIRVFGLSVPGYTPRPDNPLLVQFQPVWFDLLGFFLLGAGLYILLYQWDRPPGRSKKDVP